MAGRTEPRARGRVTGGLCPQTEVCAGPTKGWGVAWCQGTPICSVESQVPCWTQAWLQRQERRGLGWKGPQVGVTLCPLPGQKGASPQAPSLKPGEGDALMLEFLDKFFKSFRGNWADQTFHPTLGRTDLLPPKEMSSDPS